MKKNWIVGVALILSAIIAIAGVWHVGKYAYGHLGTVLIVFIFVIALYYLTAVVSILRAKQLSELREFVGYGPLKDFARVRFLEVLGRLSEKELGEDIKWLFNLGVEWRTLQVCAIARFQELAPRETFEASIATLWSNISPYNPARGILTEYLIPYTEARIMNAKTREELCGIGEHRLTTKHLRELYGVMFLKFFESDDRRVPRRV